MKERVQFWCLIGPSLILLTLIVGMRHMTGDGWYMPLSAVVVLPICWRWKIQGAFCMTVVLLSLFLLTSLFFVVDNVLWHFGMISSISVSYIITALSLDESEDMVKHLHLEAKSRYNNLLRLDEKLRMVQEENHNQQSQMETRIKALTKGIERYKKLCESFERKIDLMRGTIEQTESNKVLLLDENLGLKRKVERKRGSPPDENYKAMYQQLQRQFDNKSCTLQKTRVQLFHTKEQLEALLHEKEMHAAEPPEDLLLLQRDLLQAEENILQWQLEASALNTLVRSFLGDSVPQTPCQRT